MSNSGAAPHARYLGRVVVVTGAAAGIGRAIVEGVVAEGGIVVANDLSADVGHGLPANQVLPVLGDVREPHVIDEILAVALKAGAGSVDALFNNAGVQSFDPVLDLTEEDWDYVMGVNLHASRRLAIAVGRAMIAVGRGAICNTASTAGAFSLRQNASYVVSKHGVVGLTRALAVEWGQHGVRVNALCPGLTVSSMNEAVRASAPDYWASRENAIPLGRAASAAEQASMALFLNSDDASYVSGLIAIVDGAAHALYAGSAVERPVID